MEQNNVLDLIGVVVEVGPVTSIQTKKGDSREKRTVTVADESNLKI